ncbi:MAG: hypothetical protein K2J37_01490, partial [Ruminococcus sp.]|nr:hypothetical protein [Ruminococcus sp.]
SVSGETVMVSVPLENSTCSCVSRTVCRHIIAALITLRKNLSSEEISEAENPESENSDKKTESNPPAPEKETEKKSEEESENKNQLSEKDIDKINSCAEQCLGILGNILSDGTVRISENTSDNAELAAVQCHALKMADGERIMRDISTRLNDFLARRASFSMEYFLQNFCHAVQSMNELSENNISADMLGTFRQTYIPYSGELRLLPLGQRSSSGGDYEGEIYYFLNLDDTEKPFMSLSDMRPVFYDSVRRFHSAVLPWGMTVPLSKMMKNKFVLLNAKVCDGKLSQSKETKIAMTSVGDLNCLELRRLIYTDFKKAAVDLYEKNPQNELERLILIRPAKCIRSDFYKASQTYSLTIEDINGFQADVSLKYRKETKKLVELVEKLGNKMISEKNQNYTILAAANFENNRLKLYPIEIYDFIDAPEYDDEYEVPDEYKADKENIEYIGIISRILDEIEENLELVLQCGIQSETEQLKKIGNLCFNYGMKGLSRLWGDFAEAAGMYRHSTSADIKNILLRMADIYKYISAAKKRLEIILILN